MSLQCKPPVNQVLSFVWLKGCIAEGGLLLPSKDCSPVATFDNAVISSPLNTSLTRTEFGHHGNLSRCLLECCNRTDCDMVMFDPHDMLCYGMLCSVNNVCHFGSPEVGQRSFQAALLGKTRQGNSLLCEIWCPREMELDMPRNSASKTSLHLASS